MTPEQHVTAARRLGTYAARQRLDPASCPYDPTTEQPQASAWMRGYLHTRPPAPGQVDYTDDEQVTP